jgi:hypothetical protein
MAVTAFDFTQYVNRAYTALVNHTTNPFRLILATSATTGLSAIQDTAATMVDVKAATGWAEVANAAGGSNYVQNANSHLSGVAISSPTWTRTGHVWTLTTVTNPSWTTAAAGFAPAFAVFFNDVGGTDATNYPLCWWDFGGAVAGNGGTWTLTIPGTGIQTVTSA